MPALPKEVTEAWERRQRPTVLATVSPEGVPNAIYATCVRRSGQDKIVIVDNYFDKTRSNILAGSKGAFLLLTDEGESFQIKGTFSYEREGQTYQDMLTWASAKNPRVAVAVLHVEEVYSGARKLL